MISDEKHYRERHDFFERNELSADAMCTALSGIPSDSAGFETLNAALPGGVSALVELLALASKQFADEKWSYSNLAEDEAEGGTKPYT